MEIIKKIQEMFKDVYGHEFSDGEENIKKMNYLMYVLKESGMISDEYDTFMWQAEKKKKLFTIDRYNGYCACEERKFFDETKSDEWKNGYRDKEKERLVRSVRYHLDYVSGKINCCYYLMNNENGKTRNEYGCYYYGVAGKSRCYDKMLQDFLRLYVD